MNTAIVKSLDLMWRLAAMYAAIGFVGHFIFTPRFDLTFGLWPI